jgi:hypothetical protein
LLSKGLQQCAIDPCLYFIPDSLWVAFWVDDFVVMAKDVQVKDKFKRDICSAFKMRDMGPIDTFLGMKVKRDRAKRVLTLQSTAHIDQMLDRFGMLDAKIALTPLPHKCCLMAATDGDELLPANTPYRALVGSLLYVATWTRPDIMFAVSQVARFQSKPTTVHWHATKDILRYLKGTRELGLTYSAVQGGSVPRGYVDASWAEDLNTRKSQTGYALLVG